MSGASTGTRRGRHAPPVGTKLLLERRTKWEALKGAGKTTPILVVKQELTESCDDGKTSPCSHVHEIAWDDAETASTDVPDDDNIDA